MFSLKTTELKLSKIGIALWLVFAGCCALLLRLFWFPSILWWALLLVLLISVVGLLGWRYCHGPMQVGIDEFGAYWQASDNLQRLQFVRANGVQLIATTMPKEEPEKELKKRLKEGRLIHFLWPTYRVIYRDSVPYETYRLLRSYAAQQMMLRRSEEAKNSFTDGR